MLDNLRLLEILEEITDNLEDMTQLSNEIIEFTITHNNAITSKIQSVCDQLQEVMIITKENEDGINFN